MKNTKYTAEFVGKTYTVHCMGFLEAFVLICVEIYNDGSQMPCVMRVTNEYGTTKLLTTQIS